MYKDKAATTTNLLLLFAVLSEGNIVSIVATDTGWFDNDKKYNKKDIKDRLKVIRKYSQLLVIWKKIVALLKPDTTTAFEQCFYLFPNYRKLIVTYNYYAYFTLPNLKKKWITLFELYCTLHLHCTTQQYNVSRKVWVICGYSQASYRPTSMYINFANT